MRKRKSQTTTKSLKFYASICILRFFVLFWTRQTLQSDVNQQVKYLDVNTVNIVLDRRQFNRATMDGNDKQIICNKRRLSKAHNVESDNIKKNS